jgi:hypothetical protein
MVQPMIDDIKPAEERVDQCSHYAMIDFPAQYLRYPDHALLYGFADAGSVR